MSRFYPAPPEPQAPAQKEAPKYLRLTPLAAELPPVSAPSVPAPAHAAQSAKELTINTHDYVAVFTTQGARSELQIQALSGTSADDQSPPYELITAAPGVPFPLGMSWPAPAPFDDGTLLDTGVSGGAARRPVQLGTSSFEGRYWYGSSAGEIVHFFRFRLSDPIGTSVRSPAGGALTPELLLTEKERSQRAQSRCAVRGLIALVDNKIKRETQWNQQSASSAATYPGRGSATRISFSRTIAWSSLSINSR